MVLAAGGTWQAVAKSVDPDNSLYARQEDRLVPLDPLRLAGNGVIERVDEFYGYDGTPNTGLERIAVSNLGTVAVGDATYLLLTHGRGDIQQKNGILRFAFDSLPDGEWVVMDDRDDFHPEEHETERPWSNPPDRVEWRWARSQADGGIFGDFKASALAGDGIDADAELTITAAFDCGITDWHALSWSGGDSPARASLNPALPVHIGATEAMVVAIDACYGPPPLVDDLVTVTVRTSTSTMDLLEAHAEVLRFGPPDAPGAEVQKIERDSGSLTLWFDARETGFHHGEGRAGVGELVGKVAELSGKLPETDRPIIGRTEIRRCTESPGTVVVEQGDRSFELEPVVGDERVYEFYGYENYRSTNPFAQSRTTRLVPYLGPAGLSLVFFHGAPEDGHGGDVTMTIAGLDDRTSWVLVDDCSDWTREGSSPPETIHWKWDRVSSEVAKALDLDRSFGDQADGGILRGGLDGPFDLDLDLSVERGIDALEVVDGSTGEAFDLAVSEPVSVSRGLDPGVR